MASDTPLLDQLESGPWPSFVADMKEAAKAERIRAAELSVLEAAEKWEEKESESRAPIYGVELNLWETVRAYKAEKERE